MPSEASSEFLKYCNVFLWIIFSLGDFVADGNFDEVVTQILNQVDGSNAHQRLSEEDLLHLPRVKVAKEQVDNEGSFFPENLILIKFL